MYVHVIHIEKFVRFFIINCKTFLQGVFLILCILFPELLQCCHVYVLMFTGGGETGRAVVWGTGQGSVWSFSIWAGTLLL